MIPRHIQIAMALLLLGFVGGGIYMFQLRRHDLRTSQNSSSRHASAPAAGPETAVTLAVAYDDDQAVVTREFKAALPTESTARARQVLRDLLDVYAQKPSPHPLAEGSDVRAVFIVAGGLYVVDLNGAFAAGHRSGILTEQMTLASIVETLAANFPDVHRVKFLVDGNERPTLAGHADLSMVYDAAAVHQFVQQLQ